MGPVVSASVEASGGAHQHSGRPRSADVAAPMAGTAGPGCAHTPCEPAGSSQYVVCTGSGGRVVRGWSEGRRGGEPPSCGSLPGACQTHMILHARWHAGGDACIAQPGPFLKKIDVCIETCRGWLTCTLRMSER